MTSKTPAMPMLTSNDDVLRAIESFSDVLELFNSSGIAVTDYSHEFGSGFTLVNDKSQLVGVEFMILEFKQTLGDHGEFSILHIVTIDGRKVIVIDGSTGIHAQCTEMLKHGKYQGIHVRGGLTRSDYTYEDENGVAKPATTYYLSQ